MKNLNVEEQLEILDKTYVSADEIYHLYPFSKETARSLFDEVMNELINQDIPILPGRPARVPLKRILERYPIDRKGIERSVSRKS